MKKSGKIKNATPTLYDGIQFRSKLEVYCYQKLKEADLNFEYEKEKFVLMDGFQFPNRSFELIKKKGVKVYDDAYPLVRKMTYTPDFTNLKDNWIIECKGRPNDQFSLRWKLFKKYIVDNGLGYNLYVPRNRKQIDETIKLILCK